MQTAAVVIDSWKLEIFRKNLKSYTFTEHGGITAGSLILRVETNDVLVLQSVVAKANQECARWKRLN